jgi:hypothetical protein
LIILRTIISRRGPCVIRFRSFSHTLSLHIYLLPYLISHYSVVAARRQPIARGVETEPNEKSLCGPRNLDTRTREFFRISPPSPLSSWPKESFPRALFASVVPSVMRKNVDGSKGRLHSRFLRPFLCPQWRRRPTASFAFSRTRSLLLLLFSRFSPAITYVMERIYMFGRQMCTITDGETDASVEMI